MSDEGVRDRATMNRILRVNRGPARHAEAVAGVATLASPHVTSRSDHHLRGEHVLCGTEHDPPKVLKRDDGRRFLKRLRVRTLHSLLLQWFNPSPSPERKVPP